MVEFGLKLEDNRVAEWGEFYVSYEKLKQILKKHKDQLKRFNELAARDPTLANSLKDLLNAGGLTPITSFASIKEELSNNDGESPEKNATMADASHTKVVSFMETSFRKPESERTGLLEENANKTNSGSYGSSKKEIGQKNELNQEEPAPPLQAYEVPTRNSEEWREDSSSPQRNSRSETSKSDQSETSSVGSNITHVLRKAASGVTELFTNPLQRHIKDSLLQGARYSAEFEQVMMKDIEMVNKFYFDKLKELEDRLEFLKESAAMGLGLKRHQLLETSDEDVRTTHRRLKSPLEFAKSFVRLSVRASEKEHIGLDLDEDDEEIPLAGVSKKEEDKAQRKREAESIQRALVDQYRTAKLLHNFAILNLTGFVKIVKKHDKAIPEEKGKYKQAVRGDQICNEGRAIEDHATRLEKLYASWFCGGNRSEARAQLLPKKGDSLEMDWSQFRLGYRLGMCTILGLWVCWDCFWGVVSEGSTTIGERTAFPVFRACGGLLTLQWFWGMSAWVWSRYRINYIYLFDFDPRIVASPLKIFNEAVDNTLVFLTTMLLYYKSGVHDLPGDKIPAGIFPFFLTMYTIVQLALPTRTRVPMWMAVWRLVTTPLHSPSFFDGYVGDIFTSMVKVFQDLAWTAFFILSGEWLIPEDNQAPGNYKWEQSFRFKHVLIPLLTLLPLWFRFSQCLRRYADTGDRFPHLLNALKYALSQTVTLFGAFHPLYLDLTQHQESDVFQLFWMCTFIGSSLYSFGWDVYMDWGLGRPKHAFLGPRLMYPQKGAYYAIIALDLVLRFAWVLTLIPPHTGAKFALPDYLTAVSMVLELGRRTMWGFLRLENEHRSNTAGYRRVGFVPLHFATGHMHEYTQEKKHRGFSVLIEVTVITLLVVVVSFISVIAAQHATERANNVEL
ncbi:hypothetical protein ACA910_016389 [Epithemia clementina (nom. ined.)]